MLVWGGDALTQHNSSLMICKGRCNRCCQCLVPWTLSSSLSTLAERHLQPGLPLYSTHHSSEAAKKLCLGNEEIHIRLIGDQIWLIHGMLYTNYLTKKRKKKKILFVSGPGLISNKLKGTSTLPQLS